MNRKAFLHRINTPATITEESSKNYGKKVVIVGIGKRDNEYVYLVWNSLDGLLNTEGEVESGAVYIDPDWLTFNSMALLQT